MKGRKFTFHKGKGAKVKLSKIDRFLVCHNFVGHWSYACLMALPHFLLDHSPLVVATNPVDFGPLSFRFFNSWFDRPGFDLIIKKVFDFFSFVGTPDLFLVNKLKHIKNHLKEWKAENKVKEEETFEKLKSELFQLDSIMEYRDLSEEEQWIHSESKAGLLELNEFKHKDMRQKCKVKWASFGDENSSYFHGLIKNKEIKNKMHGMVINGVWSNNPKLIKREACKFFGDHFKESTDTRTKLVCAGINRLSEHKVASTIEPFSDIEIKNIVWENGDDRAPAWF